MFRFLSILSMIRIVLSPVYLGHNMPSRGWELRSVWVESQGKTPLSTVHMTGRLLAVDAYMGIKSLLARQRASGGENETQKSSEEDAKTHSLDRWLASSVTNSEISYLTEPGSLVRPAVVAAPESGEGESKE